MKAGEMKKQCATVYAWGGRGGHLGVFWVGMCRPGLQIGTPF